MYINKHTLNEQDALNYLFSKKYTKLPVKFNRLLHGKKYFDPPLKIERAIYHFATSEARPSFDTNDVFNRLYLEYFLKTPWATADMFGNIDKELKKIFSQTVNNSKKTLLYFTNLLARRQRAFVVEKNNIDALKKIFEIKDDELIIDTSETNSVQRLLDEMTKSKDEKIFFLFVSNYWQLGTFLFIKNFVEGVNFVNAMMFLSERQGLKINFDTKLIVQAM